MRVAIAHDYLNQYGGAERVLETLLEVFPEAPVYTLLYDEEKTLGRFKNRRIHTALLNNFEIARRRHRLFIPFLPLVQAASPSMRLGKKFDLIISSTAGFAKGINYKSGFHLCYCHTPLRYAWEEDYLNGYGFFDNILVRALAKPALAGLRYWDKSAADRVNFFIANSRFIADKIKKYYGREAVVLYPPVDLKKFYYVKGQGSKVKDYYLMVGRFLHYKRFDLGIQAFNYLKMPLKIVGAGPEAEKLKNMAQSPLIEFTPFKENTADLRKLYGGARALIFPQVEDFGLVAAEAQACGLPVIAYRGGGAREIVIEGETGIFFNEQTPMSVIQAVGRFESMSFSRPAVARSARRFSEENFKKKFLDILRDLGFNKSHGI